MNTDRDLDALTTAIQEAAEKFEWSPGFDPDFDVDDDRNIRPMGVAADLPENQVKFVKDRFEELLKS
jgi:hypothetical protein